MDPSTTIASLGGAFSFRVVPARRPAPASLRALRRTDRLVTRLSGLQAVARHQGDPATAYLYRQHQARLRKSPSLLTFSAG